MTVAQELIPTTVASALPDELALVVARQRGDDGACVAFELVAHGYLHQ